MFKLILEIIFTIAFIIGMIVNCVTGSAWLAALDGVVVGLGIGNCLLIYFNHMNAKKSTNKSETESKQD